MSNRSGVMKSSGGSTNMRIEIKGLYWTCATLADGTKKFYYYAWKNGPRVEGEYGTPKFTASYNNLIATKVAPPEGRFALTQGYQRSADFNGSANAPGATTSSKSPRSNRSSATCRSRRGRPAHPRHLHGLARRSWQGVAAASRIHVDGVWRVFWPWAKDRGKITVNPCETGRARLSRHTRRSRLERDDEAAFLNARARASALPLLLGLWTGQRAGRSCCA